MRYCGKVKALGYRFFAFGIGAKGLDAIMLLERSFGKYVSLIKLIHYNFVFPDDGTILPTFQGY